MAGGYRRPAGGRAGLLLVAALAAAGVAAALVSQHVFDMRPCPWCILQRLIFVVIAGVALLGGLWPARAARSAAAVMVALLGLAGVGTAFYQHFVAARSLDCNLTLADRIVNSLGLSDALPAVFQATATCAEAPKLLGLPYVFWSAALLALLALLGAASARAAFKA